MPPDISAGPSATAGPLALAAAPPGTAGLPEPLNTSLFAAFLAQSGPPSVTAAAVPKTAVPIAPADPKQALLSLPNTKPVKTMDTLPLLSFPPAPKAKDKASELLLPSAPIHQAAACQAPADAPGSVPLVLSFVMPVLTPPAALIKTPPAGTALAASAAPPMPPAVLMPAGLTLPGAPQVSAPQVSAPQVSAPQVSAPQAVMPTVLLPNASASSKEPTPVPMAVPPDVKASAKAADALPCVPSPVQAALPDARQEPALQAQAALLPAPGPVQAPTVIPIAAVTVIPIAAVTVQAVVQGTPAPLRPATTAGKILAAALKPAAGNADTSTRTPEAQAEVVTAKSAVPAAAPEPLLTPEKHPSDSKSAASADTGESSALLTLPATGIDAAKTAAKPFSPAERAEVIRQTADGVGALPQKPGAAQQMSVQLHPKDWGQLQVSVSVAPSQDAGAAKTVTAHIIAETPQVRAALQSGTGALQQALRASGLHLEHLTVSVKAPEPKAPDAQPQAQAQSASAGHGNSSGFGQPSSSSGGFGTGGWQHSRRQDQSPPTLTPGEPDAEEISVASAATRHSAGRIDTHA